MKFNIDFCNYFVMLIESAESIKHMQIVYYTLEIYEYAD